MRDWLLIARGATFAALLLVPTLYQPAEAEEQKMNAFAMWKGEGYLVQTGPKQGTFSGTLVGNMYILTDKGPQLFGGMVCPASIDIGLEDKSQTGRGRCVITSKDDAHVFAEITCTGFHMVGCDGDFKITGGSGRFGGITGGGRVMLRMDSPPTVAGLPGGVATEQGTGTIYWLDLTFKTP